MVLEQVIPTFLSWFPGALLVWSLVIGILIALGGGLAWIFGALWYGPQVASEGMGRALIDAVPDLFAISPRRTLALAHLAIKESIRRRVIAVFAVFLAILLFAGWFLDPSSENPARLYMSFVLTLSSYLLLLLVLFLSSMSLPTDIKNRTIHTVVTKPVRASEIVLGRIVGFTAMGTLLLGAMCLISYVFVERGLNHTHHVVLSDLKADSAATADGKTVWRGKTSTAQRHQHEVRIDSAGHARLETERGHWHDLDVGDKVAGASGSLQGTLTTGQPAGLLLARVPVYGTLRFLDRSGRPTDKGICVGDEWTYRSYIEGGTLAAAVWSFDNVQESAFAKGLPVEMTLGVFRTYKGDISKGILGSLSVVNPQTGAKAEVKMFRAKEFSTNTQFIPRTLQVSGQEKDLFRDFVSDGKVEIHLQCLEPMQYYGAAQPDMYLRAADVSFSWNFVKGYFGIWLQMVLIIGFGVMFSTFLSGPIAMLTTVGVLVAGLFRDFMHNVASGQNLGGGPLESLVRVVRQDNVVDAMEAGMRTNVLKGVDKVLGYILGAVTAALPDFSAFDYSRFVAYGFDIPANLVEVQATTMLAFLLPVFVVGYFFLKMREVAQ